MLAAISIACIPPNYGKCQQVGEFRSQKFFIEGAVGRTSDMN